MIQALTRLDVPILSKTFRTPRQAKSWAASEGYRYGAHRLVQHTARGPRTIWKAPPETTPRGSPEGIAAQVEREGSRDEHSSLSTPERGGEG
jgi:hypothetical protein